MSGDNRKLVLLEISESKRIQLFRKIRKKLRQKAIEAKMWRELLQVDNLTINGNIVWRKNQQPSRSQTNNTRKK